MRLLSRPTNALLLAIFPLFLMQCTGETGTDNQGSQHTDSTVTTQPVSNRKPAAYNPQQNQVNPVQVDFFDFYTRQVPYPFNSAFIQAKGVEEVEVHQYNKNENENLSANSQQDGLVMSKHFSFDFSPNGRTSGFSRLALIGGEGVDSVSLLYAYADGLVRSITIQEPVGESQAVYNYVDQRLSLYEDQAGTSISYQYDEENQRRYENHFKENGFATLVVYGPENSFSDEVCLDIQADALTQFSKFVDFNLAKDMKEVTFIEGSIEHPIRKIEMGGREVFRGTHVYNYDENGSLNEREFKDPPEGGLLTTSHFFYNDFGDLEKVTFEEVENGIVGLGTVHEFQYDEEGRLTKRVFSRKSGVGSTKVERLDFFSYP